VTTFLDISGSVREGSYEEGLLAFAVAPDYATSGRVFAFYTNRSGNLQLDEYARSATAPDRSEAATRRPVLTIPHNRSQNHNGGQLLFGQDGYLYLSTGDGDLAADRDNDAQRLDSLLGKILRIDVDAGVRAAGASPRLRVRLRARQRVLRLHGAVAYVRTDETTTVSATGRLRAAGREYRLGPAVRTAWAGLRVRVVVPFTHAQRGAVARDLRRGRRPSVQLSLRAGEAPGPLSPIVNGEVEVSR
jgi:hypothetical protein